MKRLTRWLSLLSLIIGCLGLFGSVQSALAAKTEIPKISNEVICPEFTQKIDLNNANTIAFKDCQGLYPTLASLIIKNSPYQQVEDVLTISGLSDRQKALLKSQLKHFTIQEAIVPLEMRMPPRPVMR